MKLFLFVLVFLFFLSSFSYIVANDACKYRFIKSSPKELYENSFCVNKNNKCFISDPPIVTLRLGSTLSDNIKEGDDVYFECLAVANPQWRKLYWLHDVSKNKKENINIARPKNFIFSFWFFGTWHFILLLLLHDFIGREIHEIYVCAAVSKYMLIK